MVDDCIENMEVNLKCPTCNEDLPTVRQGKSTRHNISVALNDKIDALVTAMRAVTPQNLTQLQLDDFRNDWWTYEDEYVAENLAANCKGLIGVENRDYSVRDYSL